MDTSVTKLLITIMVYGKFVGLEKLQEKNLLVFGRSVTLIARKKDSS
jgi:hypothetical protein